MIPMAKPRIGEEELEAVNQVMRSGMLAQGDKVLEFEEAFAKYIGVKHAIAVNSGTAALHVSLMACGVSNTDGVVTTPFTFAATGNAIRALDGLPQFIDIQEDTYNIDPELIQKHIWPDTKAILPVHLYGNPCDIERIMDIANVLGMYVIEDACQAHGAEVNGKKVGSFGIGCFSFYPTKNMTAGEGGMITTNDDEIARKCRILRNQGQKERYVYEMVGLNYRMTNIAAAIGLVQLKYLDEWNNIRIRNAELLNEGLKDVEGIVTPKVRENVKHVYHQYTVRVTESFGVPRQIFREVLTGFGIGNDVYYPSLVYHNPGFGLRYSPSNPVAFIATGEVLSLPVHPFVTESDIQFIVETIKNIKDGVQK